MHDFMSGRLLNVLPPALAGVILFATAWFHLRAAPLVAAPTPPVPESVNPFSAAPTVINSSEIAGWALFGTLAASSGEVVLEPTESLEDLPSASIELKLHGIAYSLDEARAFAIVSTPDGQQREFRAGDSLLEGVTVHAIRPLEVVISNQGKLESVALPLESATGGSPSNLGYPAPGLPQIQMAPPDVSQMPIQEPMPMPDQ